MGKVINQLNKKKLNLILQLFIPLHKLKEF